MLVSLSHSLSRFRYLTLSMCVCIHAALVDPCAPLETCIYHSRKEGSFFFSAAPPAVCDTNPCPHQVTAYNQPSSTTTWTHQIRCMQDIICAAEHASTQQASSLVSYLSACSDPGQLGFNAQMQDA
ncbi:hypothetical protein BX600DRAFT_455362 [Xylariales sp. PMI_506]|nr:hypothetical protein BX600DRAFT_455362 [Xylariales sp. PMI_506]